MQCPKCQVRRFTRCYRSNLTAVRFMTMMSSLRPIIVWFETLSQKILITDQIPKLAHLLVIGDYELRNGAHALNPLCTEVSSEKHNNTSWELALLCSRQLQHSTIPHNDHHRC